MTYPSHAHTQSQRKNTLPESPIPKRFQKSHFSRPYLHLKKWQDLCQSHVRWGTIQSEDEGRTLTREHTGHSQKRQHCQWPIHMALEARTRGQLYVKEISQEQGMEVMNTHLLGICGSCVMGKMDEKPFQNQTDWDSQIFGTIHADLMGPMTLEAWWSHAKFSLVVHDECSSSRFVFNLTHKDHTVKVLIDLDKVIENKFQKQAHLKDG